ncbi:uncharacterized PE-PGRS family protein PE_PGRS54 isoform X2 [Anopheles gambiae]|uniref:uncharacterized PE-PGRS family protein PE_PGRS54 isoform X2 n=1 Tax=Anopheles gambiae TaxID=7165 RepID=UPI002AC8D0B1|nr:uncharacterized PE-PGRS family protein PE_PGRS54 isoform X2 [Anopheles gambiae]
MIIANSAVGAVFAKVYSARLITMASKNPSIAWIVCVVIASLTTKGYGWNLPASYYQGAGGAGAGGGYFGGRGESTLNNQGLAGASAGSWNAGGVGGGGGFPSQGQTGAGASSGVDRAASFGGNQWSAGGDGRGLGGGVAPGGVSTGGGDLGAGGTGFQQGGTGAGVGGSGSGAPLGAGSGSGFGYNGQAGGFGGSNFGQGFGGSFGGSGGNYGPSGHHHGYRHPTTYAGRPMTLVYPAGGWPWHGVGYVYRVPVAHINPDGSYGFSYYTPNSARDETGHANGNVEGTYGFQNDGAKHNFSFNAAPDVDLRSSIGDTRLGGLNPDEYGPQSVHSRGRLPLIPATSFDGAADEQTRTADGLPVSVEQSTGANSWSTRSGIDGAGSEGGSDDSSLSVVGLPKATTEAGDASQPTARDQVVRGSTEHSANELDGRRLGGFDGTATTVRPLGGSVEQVGARPVNDVPSYSNEIDRNGVQYNGGVGIVPVDRSYQFGYQTPDATREESADQAGNVRGSFSYNNEAGRNDLQYVAGTGMGFRPTGGSLSVPNGLPGDNGQRFGPATGAGGVFGVDGGRSLGAGSQGAQVGGGLGGAFGGSDAGFVGDGRSVATGDQGAPLGGTAGSGFGMDGRSLAFGSQGSQLGGGVGGGFGTGVGNGFGADGRPLGSGTGVGVDGRSFGSQPGGGFGAGSGAGFGADGRPLGFGNQGTQTVSGTGSGAGFGADGRPLGFGNQGTQSGGDGVGGAFGTRSGSGFGAGGFGNQGASGAAFGADGRRLGFGNQGTQFGAGGNGASFGGSDGRSFGFGNQGGQGFATADRGLQAATTRNPVTRSPSAGSFDGSGLSSADEGEESTTLNAPDDSEQRNTFGGFGDVSRAGLFTNANRRLVQ